MPIQILTDYPAWIARHTADHIDEIDCGMWWRLYPNDPTQWRVSYNEDAKVLYAVNLATLNEYIIIAHFEATEDMDRAMRRWTEITPDLPALIEHLSLYRPPPTP